MVKNILIFIIFEEENREFVEFQVFHFTNKIWRLTSYLELHKKKLFISERFAKSFGKTSMVIGLFGKKKLSTL